MLFRCAPLRSDGIGLLFRESRTIEGAGIYYRALIHLSRRHTASEYAIAIEKRIRSESETEVESNNLSFEL